MDHSDPPPAIQGIRFDIETLQYNALKLAQQADKGPTFLRQNGVISYVVMTEEIFDEIWPDGRRAWSVDEMPERVALLFQEAVDAWRAGRPDDETT